MPLSSLLAGFGLGLSLIVAIGAQNVFVLRQGIRREHVFAVAAICALSDLALIVVGVSGIGVVLAAVPWLVDVIRWAGAAFLVAYGLLAARRAIRPSGETLEVASAEREVESAEADAAGLVDAGAGTPAAPADPAASVSTTLTRRSTGLAAAVLTCLALTWLNPHVYLDTVFLLGSVANTHGDGRWAFAAGAGIASLVWFFGLAYGARLLGGVLSSPRAWRVLDAVIAVVMVGLGVMLVLPH
ncbi:LysE/ArgO family amino acid transporter [Agromyces cerinus]|uniref:L-lysine exporter family protein LysE/ArgO n=1 Tax=Agromyces cerinus subsp. cerinus TaxID=232089 RepID=A0A1N6GRR0_9MICO|nr:LysE/ArgO family amino acid transporter [Agromyces cerinus]SIO10230.1 L-lysine exporter family protein LysE/ArgO [Agromyces cerinus subsp. cerinus]